MIESVCKILLTCEDQVKNHVNFKEILTLPSQPTQQLWKLCEGDCCSIDGRAVLFRCAGCGGVRGFLGGIRLPSRRREYARAKSEIPTKDHNQSSYMKII